MIERLPVRDCYADVPGLRSEFIGGSGALEVFANAFGGHGVTAFSNEQEVATWSGDESGEEFEGFAFACERPSPCFDDVQWRGGEFAKHMRASGTECVAMHGIHDMFNALEAAVPLQLGHVGHDIGVVTGGVKEKAKGAGGRHDAPHVSMARSRIVLSMWSRKREARTSLFTSHVEFTCVA